MDTLRFDLTAPGGDFKPLNCVNGGPRHKRHAADQFLSNLEDYRAARIPFARNHDAALYQICGGPWCHDISWLFPDFDADPDDPKSYDFANTDERILITLEAGTRTFFRLGQSIEHQIKKHAIFPPKDFKKWAVICEHVIRHYTEGWADGFRHDMPYWEIWNEPDLDEKSENKRTWAGTERQFYDLYEITAKHLKARFPHLKIGGPALTVHYGWAERFLAEMQRRGVPMDFVSWHIYFDDAEKMLVRAKIMRDMMDKYGYTKAESILSEYNYIASWSEGFRDSLYDLHGPRGAANTAAAMCAAADSSIDMLMYYDFYPGAFGGAFDFTGAKQKPYWPTYWYGTFYGMRRVPAAETPERIRSLCGVDKDGRAQVMLVHYEPGEAPAKRVKLDLGRPGRYEVRLLDEAHDGEITAVTDKAEFELANCAVLLVREV